MPNIPERSRLIKRAVCDAWGLTPEELMVGNNEYPAGEARRSAHALYDEHLQFMGRAWIQKQLGYQVRSGVRDLAPGFVNEQTHERARKIYSALMREARERES